MINLIGVYKIKGFPDAHLLEFIVNDNHTNIDIGKFTQRQEGIDQMSWQVPYDEKYLNNEGTQIIGDWINGPKSLYETTRIAFFLHFIDFSKPLITPFGEIDLKQPEPMPERFVSIIKYEEPD